MTDGASNPNPNPNLNQSAPESPGAPDAADHLVVRRRVDLDASLDQLWRLVSSPSGLEGWLGDTIDVDIAEGAGGTIIDGETLRDVVVDEVVHEHRVALTWWRPDEPEYPSHVVLEVWPLTPHTTRLDITETLDQRDGPAHSSAMSSAMGSSSRHRAMLAGEARIAWEVRTALLWAATTVACCVR